MRTLILSALLLFAFGYKSFSQTGAVMLQVINIDTKKGGELSVGFFSEDNFPKIGRQSFGSTKEVNGSIMQLTFEQVPAGTYGIAVFQDVDKNKDLNPNFLGFPTEPFGFSNDTRIRFGPPSFEDAKITVDGGKTLNLVIHLR